MFGISTARLVIYGIVAIVVLGGAFMLRHELIEKGKAIVYAEDNAARVKAQEDQIRRDAATVDSQRKYIERLELSGVQIKETIRVVQGPCKDDGAGDPRFGLFNEWLKLRRQGDNGTAPDRPALKGAVR